MIQKFYILNLDTTLLEHIHAMTKTHTCLPAQRHNQRKERKNTVKKGYIDRQITQDIISKDLSWLAMTCQRNVCEDTEMSRQQKTFCDTNLSRHRHVMTQTYHIRETPVIYIHDMAEKYISWHRHDLTEKYLSWHRQDWWHFHHSVQPEDSKLAEKTVTA